MAKKTIHITIDPKLHKELKKLSKKIKTPISVILTNGAAHELENHMSEVRD